MGGALSAYTCDVHLQSPQDNSDSTMLINKIAPHPLGGTVAKNCNNNAQSIVIVLYITWIT